MDFRFSSEEESFRTEVKEFLAKELPPRWQEQFDSEDEMGMAAQGEFAKAFNKKLAQRNWLALPWQAGNPWGQAILIAPDGTLDVETLGRLSALRDDRPIALGE